MNKLLIILSILFASNLININVSAEVNIDLLKQKYSKCEDNLYLHNCFSDFKFTLSRKVGYFRNNDLWDGLFYTNGVLIAKFINGKRFGKSKCKKSNDGWTYCPSGNRYNSFGNGFSNDNGNQGNYTIEFKSGNKYVGEVKDGLFHGQGTYTYSNGGKYVGEHKENKKHGKGTYTYTNGDKYVGKYKDNAKHGQGTYTFANGTIKEGIWKDGKFMYAKKSTSTSNPKIEGYKSFCSDIGFTPGTEKFGECVVEAMKKG